MKTKVEDLHNLSLEDLNRRLKEASDILAELYLKKKSSPAEQYHRFKQLRKSIAQFKTLIHMNSQKVNQA